MRLLVVDDEPLARRRLRRLLEEIDGCEVVGEAGDGREAQACIARTRPDAVFLDIQMPQLDGLTLAAQSCSLPPVVFVTAYDAFAVRAFELGALDYLLKPISRERLALTLDRLRDVRASQQTGASGRLLGAWVARQSIPAPARLVCASQDELRVFDARQITRFWASSKYTLFLADGAEQLTDESLQTLQERFEPFGFLRVHRAELVNMSHARALTTHGGEAVLWLTDDQQVPVSRRRLGAVRARLLPGT